MEDLKKYIEQKTGIPAKNLTGKTPAELLEETKRILRQQKQSTRDQFADWMNGTDAEDSEPQEAISYPVVDDSGEADVSKCPDGRSTREHFETWFKDVTAFNPRRG